MSGRYGRGLWVLVVLGLAVVAAPQAHAGDKDLSLRRLAEAVPVDPNDPNTKFNANPDVNSFRALSRDLGVIFGPKFLAPAETLGEAGFDVGVEFSSSTVDEQAAHWRALDGGTPDSFLMGQVHVRKGLPFSLEFGGSLSHLFDSEMYGLGTELKLSLNEGFFYLPDLAVRGTFNTILGSSDLNLFSGGFDVSISKSFGIFGVVSLTPYAGFNYLTVIASSRLLDVTPEDPTPPTIDEQTGELEFQPEFVFASQTQSVNRFFGGARLLFGVLNISAEFAYAEHVQTYSGRIGFDF
jgi:hypothetical protein